MIFNRQSGGHCGWRSIQGGKVSGIVWRSHSAGPPTTRGDLRDRSGHWRKYFLFASNKLIDIWLLIEKLNWVSDQTCCEIAKWLLPVYCRGAPLHLFNIDDLALKLKLCRLQIEVLDRVNPGQTKAKGSKEWALSHLLKWKGEKFLLPQFWNEHKQAGE